jgi:predicted amidohydrolase YtcJ
MVVVAIAGCVPAASASPASAPVATTSTSPTASSTADAETVVLVGTIVTLDDPPRAEAIAYEDGEVVAAGSRDEILAVAGDQARIIELGSNVVYPGFIDAHAHWIGDRDYYGIGSPAAAMDAAAARGWASISEQWVDPERVKELETLAEDNALPLRVDAYLALNALEIDGQYGDWYADREPGPVSDRLRVQGLKIHLDSGTGAVLFWEPADLTATIGRAVDAGWQVSVHAVSTEAQEMVLDAFETAIGPSGPNPLHHRIEHALQVTDDQLARMVAMDLVPVIQLDGAPYDWVMWAASAEGDRARDLAAEDLSWLARWSDFLEAGLHVAATSDAPWFFPDGVMTDDLARPMDQIAGGMDGRGRDFPETPDWMLDQLLTAEQGLRAVTIDAAYALGDEDRRGHLAPGTLADVTILSGDVTSATPDEIRELDVIATIVGGTVAYCSDPGICRKTE